MIRTVVLSACCLAAVMSCSRDSSEPKKTVAIAPVEVQWSVARDGSTLVIDYTLRNNTGEAILLFDLLRMQSRGSEVEVGERVIVKAADAPGEVLFVAGYLDPDPGYSVEHETFPGYRPVAAGTTVHGRKVVAWPLSPWHPYITLLQPLPDPPRTGVLQLSWLTAGAVTPQHIRTSMQQARGDALPLPPR